MSTAQLNRQIAQGVKWSLLGNVAEKILSVAATAILARILLPQDFGLFAVAFVLIDGLALFQTLGIDTALVREVDRADEAADTAFFLVPLTGLCLMVILLLAAPIYAQYTGHPELKGMIQTLALLFVFTSLNRVPGAILTKNLQFARRAFANFLAQVVFSAAAVILALLGHGVWSLVWAYMLRVIVRTSMIWYLSGWRFRGRFSKDLAKSMLHFGGFVMGSTTLAFLKTNITSLALVKIIGATAVGYYTIAYGLAFFVAQYLGSHITNVTYPAFSQIQDDPQAIARVYLKIFKHFSALTVPFSLLLIVLAPEIITLIYGSRWLPSASILMILTTAALLRSLFLGVGPVFLAYGHAKLSFKINVIETILFLAALVPLCHWWGPEGAALAVLMGTLVSVGISVFYFFGLTQISASDILHEFTPCASGSLVLLAVSVIGIWALKNNAAGLPLSTGPSLAVILLAGLGYLLMIYVKDRSFFAELKRAVT
ncbi:MAG: lipopolysaccharide biosynthesis protein [Candidatus Omnitrophica bacterium]|nr:lipopolysaccharide biosynthesis protein [Candidatus Omnitrophota bacterium]